MSYTQPGNADERICSSMAKKRDVPRRRIYRVVDAVPRPENICQNGWGAVTQCHAYGTVAHLHGRINASIIAMYIPSRGTYLPLCPALELFRLGDSLYVRREDVFRSIQGVSHHCVNVIIDHRRLTTAPCGARFARTLPA